MQPCGAFLGFSCTQPTHWRKSIPYSPTTLAQVCRMYRSVSLEVVVARSLSADIHAVLTFPTFFGYSLAKRILPRAAYLYSLGQPLPRGMQVRTNPPLCVPSLHESPRRMTRWWQSATWSPVPRSPPVPTASIGIC